MQYVEVTLDPNEMVVAEAGGIMYMTPNIEMQTVFGDPSTQQTGFLAFQKKIGVGLFGGEGFIMQRLTGEGLAFVHAGGTLMKRTLGPYDSLVAMPGYERWSTSDNATQVPRRAERAAASVKR